MRGIELLMEREIPLRLKTMLLTINKHELWEIKAYAEDLGVRFRFDPMVNAGRDGQQGPTALRLSPEEIVAFDLADPKRLADWRDFCDRFRGVPVDSGHLYACGAGLRSYHVDSYGGLSVCMMARGQQYDLREGTFHQGWHDFAREVRDQRHTERYLCNECELLSLCGQCPGWAEMEHGDPEEPVEYLCRVAHLRAEAFGLDPARASGARKVTIPG
jgi:radical SAM protein with 4Fe4S-binding SPASM domain